jgi:hypothetical protein
LERKKAQQKVLGSIMAMVVVIGVVNVEDPFLTLWWWCLG